MEGDSTVKAALASLQHGVDEDAWSLLYVRFHRAVTRLAFREFGIVGPAQQDIVQEVFSRMARYAPFRSGLQENEFRSYLRVVSQNACRRYVARLRHDPLQSTEPEGAIDRTRPLAAWVVSELRNERREILLKLIEELSDSDRLILRLYGEGYDAVEIAEATGLASRDAVYARLHRLRRRLSDSVAESMQG